MRRPARSGRAWPRASFAKWAIPTKPAKCGMPIVLDTHAWVWWVTEDRRLSRRAAEAIRKHDDGLLLSAISVWEVAKNVEKKWLVLDRPLRDWIDQALRAPRLLVVELTPSILVESCDLP